MKMNRERAAFAVAACLVSSFVAAETRLVGLEDLFALREVDDPQISPDGKWVAYTVTTLDAKEDDSDTDIAMVPMAGGEAARLTTSTKAEKTPRFSPDGRFLAFLSAREGKKKQVWLLDRRGGEAVRATDYKASVSDLAWSPDGTRLALVVSDVDPDEPEAEAETRGGAEAKPKTPKPIVIRRLQFLRDGEGYLQELRSHIHVVDVRTRASVQITSGPYDDSEPAWSPDGRLIAFTSNRTPEPDANRNSDVFVVEAVAGATPRAVTTSPGADVAPAFSPDGRLIAYVAGGDPKDMWYATTHLAVVPAAGGPSRPLTVSLDRNVGPEPDEPVRPRFTPDGKRIVFLIEDRGNVHLARVPVAGGPVVRLVAGEREVSAFDVGPKGEIVVLESRPQQPEEVSALVAGSLRRLTTVNDAVLQGLRLAPVERFEAQSADGTTIDGFLTRPPDTPVGAKLPAVLRIHGGPVMQFTPRFRFEWQILAAHGYAVIAANPRGSSGYGRDFSHAIWADWGNKDYQDVMAAVDHVVAMGVADPDRLGVGGWSYGGVLTNYVITKTGRFKAATSGASEVNYLADYGTDHYQYEWETELGLPWKNRDLWIRLSPWFDVEKITTPTLILCGAEDRNVPLLNSEQLYQALRRVGRETELVVYPGETHDIEKPSYRRDRYERYIAWYDRYLKAAPAP